MDDVGLFYGHLVYFAAILSTLWKFGTFSPVLVRCTKENLATLGLVCAGLNSVKL
jgi:hypothetical protein